MSFKSTCPAKCQIETDAAIGDTKSIVLNNSKVLSVFVKLRRPWCS